MSPFTSLIVLLLAQVHDDLLGARVQHVEELSVLRVQTTAREVIDASQSVDQFPVEFIIIFSTVTHLHIYLSLCERILIIKKKISQLREANKMSESLKCCLVSTAFGADRLFDVAGFWRQFCRLNDFRAFVPFFFPTRVASIIIPQFIIHLSLICISPRALSSENI